MNRLYFYQIEPKTTFRVVITNKKGQVTGVESCNLGRYPNTKEMFLDFGDGYFILEKLYVIQNHVNLRYGL